MNTVVVRAHCITVACGLTPSCLSMPLECSRQTATADRSRFIAALLLFLHHTVEINGVGERGDGTI